MLINITDLHKSRDEKLNLSNWTDIQLIQYWTFYPYYISGLSRIFKIPKIVFFRYSGIRKWLTLFFKSDNFKNREY